MSTNKLNELADKVGLNEYGNSVNIIRNIFKYDPKFVDDICGKVFEIEYLSGYTFDELREKLAAGWTLEPPNYKATKFSELMSIFGKED